MGQGPAAGGTKVRARRGAAAVEEASVAAGVPPIVLASASPRRAELLGRAGYMFTVRVSPVEEPEERPESVPIDMWPMVLAYIKAQAVQRSLEGVAAPGGRVPVVLGADTIVVLGETILNKPRDKAHARRMLHALSGKKHRVITGVAMLQGGTHRLARAESVCRLKRLSRDFMKRYLQSELWRGKAGAYGIQDDTDPFVTLVEGEWSNVVGLPMELLARELRCFAER